MFTYSIQRLRVSHMEAELRELVINGLTHLVSANSESGFKQCLHLAYDIDSRKRTIFAHVFARVIGEGTTFDMPEQTPTVSKRTQFANVRLRSAHGVSYELINIPAAPVRIRCMFLKHPFNIQTLITFEDGSYDDDVRGLPAARRRGHHSCPPGSFRHPPVDAGAPENDDRPRSGAYW